MNKVIHVDDMPNYPDAIYIGRAMPRKGLKASPFANPYRIGRDGNRETVIRKYAADLEDRLTRSSRQETLDALYDLIGRPLACWCRKDGEEPTPDNACHADVLIRAIRAEFGGVR